MSAGEIVGLMLTAAMLGAVAGAVATAAATLRRGRAGELRLRRIEAYGEWLAAWKTLSRASVSFVAAFRALAAEPRDTRYFALRRDEAQRARTSWCDAMRELDRAEAALIAFSADSRIRERLAVFERVSADTLREAINGDRDRVERLVRQLGETDERAAQFVQVAAMGRTCTHHHPARKLLDRVAERADAVIDQWSRAPGR